MERWLPVVGWEGIYEVSDQGRVRSLDRLVAGRHGSPKSHKGRLLVGSIGPTTGYRTCTLVDASTRRKHYALIHRLVLEAFIGSCPPGLECCHNDGDRSNAALDNLRWDTRSSNTLDAVAQRTNYQARKTYCPQGHLYDGVYHPPGRGPVRFCRSCQKERDRSRRRVKSVA
jgi:hypothetical protein